MGSYWSAEADVSKPSSRALHVQRPLCPGRPRAPLTVYFSVVLDVWFPVDPGMFMADALLSCACRQQRDTKLRLHAAALPITEGSGGTLIPSLSCTNNYLFRALFAKIWKHFVLVLR